MSWSHKPYILEQLALPTDREVWCAVVMATETTACCNLNTWHWRLHSYKADSRAQRMGHQMENFKPNVINISLGKRNLRWGWNRGDAVRDKRGEGVVEINVEGWNV